MSLELLFTPTLERYGEDLNAKPDLLDRAIQAKLNELEAQLLASIQAKLSGEVLQQRTGVLLRSVEMQAAEFTGAVCSGTVGIDDDAPSFTYGIVHEMGGLGYYDIFPKEALTLAFLGPEGMVFAKHVHHPPAQKRSFIASSAAELEGTFYDELDETLTIVIRGEAN